MTTFTATKDPDATLDYAIDWSEWIASGDSLASAVWTVSGADSAVVLSNDAVVGSVATVWVAGGTAGRSYTLNCRVTTNAGGIDDRSVQLIIFNK